MGAHEIDTKSNQIVQNALYYDATTASSFELQRCSKENYITGASDDDPSGIAIYSQSDAKLGFNIILTLILASR